MTALGISPDQFRPAGIPHDGHSSTPDAQRLQLMEEMLRDRGYSRNQHGFWVAPGSRMAAAKVESESITGGVHSEDEQ